MAGHAGPPGMLEGSVAKRFFEAKVFISCSQWRGIHACANSQPLFFHEKLWQRNVLQHFWFVTLLPLPCLPVSSSHGSSPHFSQG